MSVTYTNGSAATLYIGIHRHICSTQAPAQIRGHPKQCHRCDYCTYILAIQSPSEQQTHESTYHTAVYAQGARDQDSFEIRRAEDKLGAT